MPITLVFDAKRANHRNEPGRPPHIPPELWNRAIARMHKLTVNQFVLVEIMAAALIKADGGAR
jgi:hypothetical protein